jgi:hypothetical protein
VSTPDQPARRKVTAMSTTVTTHHSRVPLIASAAVAAVIAGAGLVSLAVNGDSSGQGGTLRTPTAQDYAQYQHFYAGAQPFDGLDGHVPPPAPPIEQVKPAQPGSVAYGGLDGHVPPAPPTTGGGRTQIGQ